MGDDVLFPIDPLWLARVGLASTQVQETWTPYLSEQVLVTHARQMCAGRFCPVHTPSNHGMREWMQWFEDGFTYRVCPHGENHADPDEIQSQYLVRGCVEDCDGCCLPARYAPMIAEWGLELNKPMTLDQFKQRVTTTSRVVGVLHSTLGGSVG